jgi:hypothetical protein
MSRIVFALALLVAIVALACNGCVSSLSPTIPTSPSSPSSSPEPVHPTTPAPVTPQPPTAQQVLSWEDIEDQMRIIEFPETAYVGEYITVKYQILNENLRERIISGGDQEMLESLWFVEDGMYELALCKEECGGQRFYEESMGCTTPDGEFIVSWYASIPTERLCCEFNESFEIEEYRGPFPPGNYRLEIRLLDPCSSGHGYCGYGVLLERNIIIKD